MDEHNHAVVDMGILGYLIAMGEHAPCSDRFGCILGYLIDMGEHAPCSDSFGCAVKYIRASF